MPTATPSPHRFLAPGLPSSQKPKAKLHSNLRHGINAEAPTWSPSTPEGIAIANQKVTPGRRFVFAPSRGEAHSALRSDIAQRTPLPASTPRPRPSLALQGVESIDEGSDSSPSSSPIGTHLSDAVAQSIEHACLSEREGSAEEGGDSDDEILFLSQNPHKRRRITPQPPSPRNAATEVAVPTPGPMAGTSSHRFLPDPLQTPVSRPTAHVTDPTNATPVPSRAQFILPAPELSPSKRKATAAPSAETFSPSRRGQKFVPGGLASTMQSWVVETSQSGYQAQIKHTVAWGRDKEDGVRMKLHVETLRSGNPRVRVEKGTDRVICYSGGVVFAQGSVGCFVLNPSEEEQIRTNVLLAGQGGMTGSAGVSLCEGDTVGIRAPTWDVDFGDQQWMVCVDWVVL